MLLNFIFNKEKERDRRKEFAIKINVIQYSVKRLLRLHLMMNYTHCNKQHKHHIFALIDQVIIAIIIDQDRINTSIFYLKHDIEIMKIKIFIIDF